MQITTCHHGVNTTILRFGEATAMPWQEWAGIATRMVDTLCRSDLFEVSNTNYRYDPGAFVTTGVECRYRKHSFAIFSDLPNEIIIKFGGLRPRKAEELVQSLAKEWMGIDG